MKLEKSFVVARPQSDLLPSLDEDETFLTLFPSTRLVSREGSRRVTATPYTAVGQTRDIQFIFESRSDGRIQFEKICDGNVWRSLHGEVRLDPDGPHSTRVAIRMEGKTRTLVPEIAIRLPMQQQLDDMARALRHRLENP